MAYMQFVFSNFWIWAGTVVLIGAAANGMAAVIRLVFIHGSWKLAEPKLKAMLTSAIRDALKDSKP